MSGYYAGMGGLPPQDRLMTGRAIFTEAYCFIPKGVMSDIVTSLFPGWDKTHGWMIARPMSGFSETFSQYIMDVAPGGGSDAPEPDAGVEGVIFVVEGELALTYGGDDPCDVGGRICLSAAGAEVDAAQSGPRARAFPLGAQAL